MLISYRGKRQEVTKILNWATDWPVLIEDMHSEKRGVRGKRGADGGRKVYRAVAEGKDTTFLCSVRCCSN